MRQATPGGIIEPTTRRAALLATAIALPLTVIVALGLASALSKDASPRATTSASPIRTIPAGLSDSATLAACAKVVASLPVSLDSGHLLPRTVSTVDAFAWGDPPVVLRCGVKRPAGLNLYSNKDVIAVAGPSGAFVQWLPNDPNKPTEATVIDRAVYIEVDLPKSGAYDPLPELSNAISSALPQVCLAQNLPPAPIVPDSELCTHRH